MGLCLLVPGHIEWHSQGKAWEAQWTCVSSQSGKYPVAIHGIWSVPPSVRVNQAGTIHYMEDYLQERFVFTQMLIRLDKVVCWKLERKLCVFSEYSLIRLLLAHFSAIMCEQSIENHNLLSLTFIHCDLKHPIYDSCNIQVISLTCCINIVYVI